MVEKATRKVWYIDTGGMTKEEAEASVKRFLTESRPKNKWEKTAAILRKGLDKGKKGP